MKEGQKYQGPPASNGAAAESVELSTDPIVVVVFMVNPRRFSESQTSPRDLPHTHETDTVNEETVAATDTQEVASERYSEEIIAEAAKYRISSKALAGLRWMADPRNRPKEAPPVTRYPPPGTYKGGYLQGIRVER